MAVECSPCKIRFTSVSAFDAHLTDGGTGPHLDPAAVPSLFRRDSGAWGMEPMPPEAVARMHRARAAEKAARATPGP